MFDSSRQIHSYLTTAMIIRSSTGLMMHSPRISLLHQEWSEAAAPPPSAKGGMVVSNSHLQVGQLESPQHGTQTPNCLIIIYEIAEKSAQ
jgi:hypothetical protein